jgi:hypothetical protein
MIFISCWRVCCRPLRLPANGSGGDGCFIMAGRVCVLVAPEVTHRKSEIHSRVDKFAQNLHVGNMMVEAEKKGLKPRFKHARFLAFRRPTRKALYVIERAFVLQ